MVRSGATGTRREERLCNRHRRRTFIHLVFITWLISHKAITAYDALEWINTNYTSFNLSSIPSRTSNLSFKEDMLNVIMNIANNVLSNYMIETDYCDDGCLARSLEVVAYRSSLAAIRWCHYLVRRLIGERVAMEHMILRGYSTPLTLPFIIQDMS